MQKVIITDYINTPDIERDILGQEVEVICLAEEDEHNFPDTIKTADAILVWHAHISSFTIDSLEKCKAIVRYGVGYDGVDHVHAAKKGVIFANTPDYGVDEVADTASAMILSLIRRVPEYDLACKSYDSGWQEHTLKPLKRTNEHKLGIIGMGRIGSAMGLRMKAFGMQVAFFDPYVVSGYAKTLGVKRFDSLEELQKFASIISIHTPLTEETSGLVDSEFINSLNDGTFLINTARGRIVDSLGSIQAGLDNGKLAGVGLDVLPQEPPKESETLLKTWKDRSHPMASRIIITPHTAYYSERAWEEMREKAARNVKRALDGVKVKNIING
jgi:lactate dehydrogenase-like 2-hydroxyacid dehydrogenase